MHVILMSDRLGHTFSFGLKRYHAWVVLVFALATMIGAGFLGFNIAAEGRVALAEQTSETDPQVNELAVRVGELQARLARMNAIGERVAAKAGVPLPAVTAEAGRGGPLLETNPPTLSAAELASLIDSLTQQLELASDQLMVLDAELLLRQASQGKLPMDRPVARGAYLSSVFGTRIDPFTGRPARHEGLDFANDFGSPILAAESGVVLVVRMHPQYGNSLDVDHGNGLVTRYAHVSRILVKKGDLVKRGQAIAEMGSTGRSTGPHLHFEVMKDGVPQNPMGYLSPAS